LLIGWLFGLLAQRSRFYLPDAKVVLSWGVGGQRTAVWLRAFGMAVLDAQLLSATGLLDAHAARWKSGPASESGAMIGGWLFGVGMALLRGR
jgi:hypothetical protein